MVAIEIVYQKEWLNLWLESDSMLVYLACKSSKFVPWQLRNRWESCLHLTSSMPFIVTHIYREGNHCANKIVNIVLKIYIYYTLKKQGRGYKWYRKSVVIWNRRGIPVTIWYCPCSETYRKILKCSKYTKVFTEENMLYITNYH